MQSFNDPHTQIYARITGALYLIIAVAGGFAIAYVPAQLHIPGDPAATMLNIQNHRGLFNLGIAGDVVMLLAEVAATTMLYFMFRTVNPTLALMAAFARLSMAIVMGVMLMFHAGLLTLIDPDAALSSFSAAQRAELAGLMLHIHNSGVWVWQLFFALHLSILGLLVARSGRFPAILGYAMTVGAFGYLADSIVAFATPEAALLGQIRIGLLVIVTLAELGFALWLLILGPRQSGSDYRVSAKSATTG